MTVNNLYSMSIIDKNEPTEILLSNLRDGIPFKCFKDEILNPTYIRTGNFITCLNTGGTKYLLDEDNDDPMLKHINNDSIVYTYKGFRIVIQHIPNLPDPIEISKTPYEKLNTGKCFIYNDAICMKTNAGKDIHETILDLEMKSLRSFTTINEVLPIPFLCMELI